MCIRVTHCGNRRARAFGDTHSGDWFVGIGSLAPKKSKGNLSLHQKYWRYWEVRWTFTLGERGIEQSRDLNPRNLQIEGLATALSLHRRGGTLLGFQNLVPAAGKAPPMSQPC